MNYQFILFISGKPLMFSGSLKFPALAASMKRSVESFNGETLRLAYSYSWAWLFMVEIQILNLFLPLERDSHTVASKVRQVIL